MAEGLVYKKTLGHYFVRLTGGGGAGAGGGGEGAGEVVCSISSKLRKNLIYPESTSSASRMRVQQVRAIRNVDPVAVGDYVRLRDLGDGTGAIIEILARRNQVVRRAAGPRPMEQTIVSNVDLMVAVFAAAEPDPNWNLLDRYLAEAEYTEIPPLICITKLDLVDPAALETELAVYRTIGYSIVLTSALTGTGIDELRGLIGGRDAVLIGKSGVGKSALLNALEPGLGLRVGAVSRSTGKGRHTTTHLERFELASGGSVVDTPGMREFGLGDAAGVDAAWLFPEMRPYLGKCRFGASCIHLHEPGCEIKAAVERGEISRRRYESYLRLSGG